MNRRIAEINMTALHVVDFFLMCEEIGRSRVMGGSSNDLSAIEQQTLLSILRLHPVGYGVTIRDEIEVQTGRKVSFGTIYATLDRLTNKGFVRSKEGEPTAERGGRRKLHFTITAPGQHALRRALQSLDALRAGTDLAGALAW